ncbi:MAG: glycosyltransferase family 39 protein partial [Methanobrevibacter sp. CfCl-M3]
MNFPDETIPFMDIYLGKISSAVPILLLMGFSWKYLRYDIGELGAGLFSFSIIAMPQLIWLLTDVRMYSWGMLFVMLAFYSAYRIAIQESWKNYVLLTFFAIIGAYTQYFCSVSIFGVYLILFTYLYLNKDTKNLSENIKKIKRLVLSGFISILAFIPWILILIDQMKNVVSSYWIPPFDGFVFYKTVIYFLSASKLVEGIEDLIGSDQYDLDTLLLSMILIAILGICIYCLFNDLSFKSLKMKVLKVNFLIFGVLILLLEIILGVLVGDMIGKPIIQDIYF